MALLSAILVLMLMSALLVGFIAMVNSDQAASGINRDQTQAYAAAHAGVEKLTADLGAAVPGELRARPARRSTRSGGAGQQPTLQRHLSTSSPNGGIGLSHRLHDDVGADRRQPGDLDPNVRNGTPITRRCRTRA